jgi:hypothetical protein
VSVRMRAEDLEGHVAWSLYASDNVYSLSTLSAVVSSVSSCCRVSLKLPGS